MRARGFDRFLRVLWGGMGCLRRGWRGRGGRLGCDFSHDRGSAFFSIVHVAFCASNTFLS